MSAIAINGPRHGPYRPVPYFRPCCGLFQFHPRSGYARLAALVGFGGDCGTRRPRGRAAFASHDATRRRDTDGAQFYDRCQRLIADVEEAESLFRATTAPPSGRVRVDVPGRIGRLIVAPSLPGFLDRYPDLEVDLGVSDRAVDLIEAGIDCVVRVGPLGDSGLIARPLGALRLINVASPAYLARHGVPRGPEDLLQHWAVNYASPSTGRVEPWEWIAEDVPREQPMRGRVTVNSAEASIACCLAGLGLLQIPAYDVRSHLREGTMVEVMPDHRAASLPISMLFPARQHLPRRVRVFADWLEVILRAAIDEGEGGNHTAAPGAS